MKGFKITDNNRCKRYGVGAESLEMLKDKAKSRFPVSILLQGCILDFHYFSRSVPALVLIV